MRAASSISRTPTATDAKIRDGWLYTGDMAYCDAEGNYFFADRKTDSMRRRGENISSFEVEKIVNQHPAVLESGAFGVPSELGEDDVMVAVVLRPGHSVAPEELAALLRGADGEVHGAPLPRFPREPAQNRNPSGAESGAQEAGRDRHDLGSRQEPRPRAVAGARFLD